MGTKALSLPWMGSWRHYCSLCENGQATSVSASKMTNDATSHLRAFLSPPLEKFGFTKPKFPLVLREWNFTMH